MGPVLDPDDEGRVTWSAVATLVGSSQSIEGRNWLELSCWPPSPPTVIPARAERADDLRDGVVLVEHIGGVEAGHLGRDRVDRVLPRLGLERRADLVGDVAHPVLAHLERGDEVLLGALHLVGSAQALGVAEFSGGRADRLSEALREARGVARPPGERVEEVRTGLDRARVQRGDAVVVVLERAFPSAGLAAVDEDRDQDDRDHDHDRKADAADHDRLTVPGRRRTATTTARRSSAARCRPWRGTSLLGLVEERHAARSLRKSGSAQYDLRDGGKAFPNVCRQRGRRPSSRKDARARGRPLRIAGPDPDRAVARGGRGADGTEAIRGARPGRARRPGSLPAAPPARHRRVRDRVARARRAPRPRRRDQDPPARARRRRALRARGPRRRAARAPGNRHPVRGGGRRRGRVPGLGARPRRDARPAPRRRSAIGPRRRADRDRAVRRARPRPRARRRPPRRQAVQRADPRAADLTGGTRRG